MADSEEHVLREIRRLYVGTTGSAAGASASAKATVDAAEDVQSAAPKTGSASADGESSARTSIGSGLCEYASAMGNKVFPPRNKAVVMIIGNHSAGKSSFINWYTNTDIQSEGLAVETRSFHLVTSGKRRETLKGSIPFLKKLETNTALFSGLEGIDECLKVEIAPSKNREFPCVDFIDSPGLVDGEVEYSFDVEEAIMRLADAVADLVLVFLDPVGQALCKRTLRMVERLNKHASVALKSKYYITKADTIPSERDRHKIIVQITQTLTRLNFYICTNSEWCSSCGKNRVVKYTHAFELPTIYRPSSDSGPKKLTNGSVGQNIDNSTVNKVPNEIEDLNRAIASEVHQLVQKSFTKFDEDSTALHTQLSQTQKDEDALEARNVTRMKLIYGGTAIATIFSLVMVHYTFCGLLLTPTAPPFSFVHSLTKVPSTIENLYYRNEYICWPFNRLLPESMIHYGILCASLVVLLCILIAVVTNKHMETGLTLHRRKQISSTCKIIVEMMKYRKQLSEDYMDALTS